MMHANSHFFLYKQTFEWEKEAKAYIQRGYFAREGKEGA
jgi:hypothetical protein